MKGSSVHCASGKKVRKRRWKRQWRGWKDKWVDATLLPSVERANIAAVTSVGKDMQGNASCYHCIWWPLHIRQLQLSHLPVMTNGCHLFLHKDHNWMKFRLLKKWIKAWCSTNNSGSLSWTSPTEAGSRETFAFETNITKISCLSYVACVAYVLINIACVADSLNPPIRKSDTVAAARHPSIGSKGRNDHLELITIALVFIGNTLTQLWCSRHHCTRRQLQSWKNKVAPEGAHNTSFPSTPPHLS